MTMTSTSRPKLLDLFCGAGGAAQGYSDAGFEVVGVDIVDQPNYPYEFHRGDAMEFLKQDLMWVFEVIHASPPCQRYIRSGMVNKSAHPDLLGPVRELLLESGVAWVIENVPGAPMRADVTLCGSMFDLGVRRHRWFESSLPLAESAKKCDHSKKIVGVYGNAHGKRGAWPSMGPSNLASWSEAMGIYHMTAKEIVLAIPPAYTDFIGTQLIESLKEFAA